MDGPGGDVGNDTAIAALGDTETVDGGAGFTGDGFVEPGRGAGGRDGDFFGELFGGFSWFGG